MKTDSKILLKTAIVELLEERKDLVRDILGEAIEDIGIAHAIEEGKRTRTVILDEVSRILKSRQ